MTDSENREIKTGDIVIYSRIVNYSVNQKRLVVTKVSQNKISMGKYNTSFSNRITIISR